MLLCNLQSRESSALARHQCEVRHCIALALSDREAYQRYLDAVKVARGAGTAEKLRDDAREQYERGNRGKKGSWK